jgi:release factor glutamine methyltransferase
MSFSVANSMITQYWLKTATQYLESKGVQTARLDALVLLEDVLKVDRAKILAEPNMEIKAAAVAILQKLLNRRADHEPLAYIRGRAEFYGRMFKVSNAVLVPRPESETMIDLLKALPGMPAEPHIADVGSGSGALGITAAIELPKSLVTLIELDDAALKVSQLNVVFHTTSARVIKSNLLAQSSENYDILLCNLPYVPDEHPLNPAANHEPKIALFAGTDGLDLYRELFAQIVCLAEKPLYILCEAFPNQHSELVQLAITIGYKLTKTNDFILVLRHQD